MILDVKKLKISRSKIVKTKAEGLEGRMLDMPIYTCCQFIKKIAYGKKGFPWTSDICNRKINYVKVFSISKTT